MCVWDQVAMDSPAFVSLWYRRVVSHCSAIVVMPRPGAGSAALHVLESPTVLTHGC